MSDLIACGITDETDQPSCSLLTCFASGQLQKVTVSWNLVLECDFMHADVSLSVTDPWDQRGMTSKVLIMLTRPEIVFSFSICVIYEKSEKSKYHI